MTEIEQKFLESGGCFKNIKAGELFSVKGNPQLNKESFVFSEKGTYPYFTRTVFNNGILGNVEYLDEEHKIFGNCLAVGMLGMQFFYMEKDFYAGQFTKSVFPKQNKIAYFNKSIALYFISLLNKYQSVYQGGLVRDFERLFNETELYLPYKDGQISLEFMENFIAELKALRVAELHAYLQATGLSDYTLTDDELAALELFNNGNLAFNSFEYQAVFDRIQQGRRLKKDDQMAGNIPFVMSGVTNTGVVNYISNPIAVFPKNSITMDIFGNAFYRDYNYGMGDDTGAYWDSKNRYSKEMMLYLTTSMNKSVEGKYSYGHKLRSSQSLNIKMQLPVKDNKLDLTFMGFFISAIQKLVIKDVVQWVDKQIEATEQVILN